MIKAEWQDDRGNGENGRVKVFRKVNVTEKECNFFVSNLFFDTYNTYLHPLMSNVQVDMYAKEPKNRHLFELLESLVKAQEESQIAIRASEQEVSLWTHHLFQHLPAWGKSIDFFSITLVDRGDPLITTAGGAKHSPQHFCV